MPAYVAKLRWSDWLARNKTARDIRDAAETRGRVFNWLATDRPVPFSAVRRVEVWDGGAWVEIRAEPPQDGPPADDGTVGL